MASDTVVRARIDGQVKERAAKVLADMGLSVSDAIRLLLVRVAAEQALPFDIKVPNAETRVAMAELASLKKAAAEAERMRAELDGFRVERKQVRVRIEKLLGQMDQLSGQ